MISDSASMTRTRVLQIAWPIILSNLSTPLLGLVDTAVIGNLGDPALIGAIAIGGMIFSFLYWGFGFLRMGTTGLVAQAAGAGDETEVKAAFYRAGLVGATIGIILVVLQVPIIHLALVIIDGSQGVETAALTYFTFRIWGAPANLALLAVIGFLLGKQDSKSLLVVQLLLNGTNIGLDLLFVMGFGWGVAGVASATVLAELLAIAVGTWFAVRHIRNDSGHLNIPDGTMANMVAIRRMLVVNRDIMIRTLCLIFAFAWFTNQGAKNGDLLLATNAILLQFVSFSAFFLDGFALAAESLVGYAIGANDRRRLEQSIRRAVELAFVTSLGLSILFLFAGATVVQILTNIEEVRESCHHYMFWAVLAPVISVWCYLLDGIFIGATRTIEMRNAMIVSLLAYLASWWLLRSFGNHGLWLSFMIHFAARGASLFFYLPRLVRTLNPVGRIRTGTG
jgi:MATE family multidrug resistance protein